jgi:hypothetical protein
MKNTENDTPYTVDRVCMNNVREKVVATLQGRRKDQSDLIVIFSHPGSTVDAQSTQAAEIFVFGKCLQKPNPPPVGTEMGFHFIFHPVVGGLFKISLCHVNGIDNVLQIRPLHLQVYHSHSSHHASELCTAQLISALQQRCHQQNHWNEEIKVSSSNNNKHKTKTSK